MRHEAVATVAKVDAEQVAREASEGACYLTDGKRLMEVIGTDAEGNIRMIDCAANLVYADAEDDVITVKVKNLTPTWKKVDPDGH